MKYYDKRIYKIEQEIKTAFLILIVFIVSFTLGFLIGNSEVRENKIERNKILKKVEER